MRLPHHPESQFEAIQKRLPSSHIIALCTEQMERKDLTIEQVEAITSDIPDAVREDIDRGDVDLGHDEDFERIHRRIFIALNWRNN